MPENYGVFIGNLTEELCSKLIKKVEITMTQHYIGVKIVEAFPQEKDGKPGYGVKYPDGYLSWSPKDVFELAYFPMGKGNDNKVTQEMVNDFFPEIEASQLDEKTVLVKGKMLTGFTQYETGSCVDPANFDMSTGSKVATKRIEDVIWKFLGFVVQWGRFGLNSLKEQEQNDKSVTELDDSFVCRE